MKTTKEKKCALLIVLIIIAVLLAAFIVLLVINRFGTDFENLSSTDQEILTELDAYCKANHEEKIWDEYKLDDTPVLLINGTFGKAYLVNPKENIKSLFAAKITMPENSDIQVYRISRLMPQIISPQYFFGNFNTVGKDYQLLGNSVYFLRYNQEDSLDAPYSSKHFITMLSHEAFHYYMQNEWTGGSRFSEALSDSDIDLLESEYAVLEQIQSELEKSEPSKKQLQKYAADYTSIMEQRIAANPKYLKQELAMETAEGTASYIGIMASKIVDYDYGVMYFDNMKNVSFADVIPTLKANGIEKSFLSDRMPYETGALLCELLSALQVENWQGELNNQTKDAPVYLYSVIKKYVDSMRDE